MTVLLVDDDQDDIEIFTDALRQVDKSIILITVHSGIQALDLLNNEEIEPPDHIFLDINMPLMTGMECLNQIKRKQRLSRTLVTVYTTSKVLTDYNKVTALGAHYIVKPNSYNELIQILSQKFGLSPGY
jgi:CheY-like chemotaxis protein